MNNPLLDKDFLLQLDKDRNRVIYTRITNLNSQQYGVERIEGVVSGGSITIDGTSTVRRICSLTLTTKNVNINSIYWSLTSRVKIELGLKNRINEEYDDIIWFPQGVFILTDFNTQQQVNNYIITLSGKDKMCLLNGDIGGVFPAETDCGKIDYQDTDGTWHTESRPIKNCILDLVHHYGGENFENILIKDLDKLQVRDYRNKTNHNAYIIKELDNDNYLDCLFYNTQIKRVEDTKSIEFGYITNRTYYYNANPQWKVDFNHLSKNFKFVVKKDISEDDVGLVPLIDQEYATVFFYITYEETTADTIFWTPSDTYYTYDAETKKYNKITFKSLTEQYIDEQLEEIFSVNTIIYKEVRHKCVLLLIEPGETIGYKVQEIIYPSDLIAPVGSTVTEIFDKIIDKFPTFEYFYNLEGQFVFQQSQQYTKGNWDSLVSVEEDEYYVNPSEVQDYVQYIFDDNKLAIAHQNTPKLSEIKNDFTVWGKRQSQNSNTSIPIHARYAIDIKPKFYRSFDGILFTTDDDYYEEYSEMVNDIVLANKPHGLPPYLVDKISWWHIEDWKEYYMNVTTKYPAGRLYEYQSSQNIGFSQRLYFPTPEEYDLVIAFEDAPTQEKNHEEYVVYIGKTPGFIFDVQTSGDFAGYPIGWSGWQDESHLKPNSRCDAAFMHRYNGCGHQYTWFLDKAERFGYDSYIYKPIIPSEEIVNEDALIDFTPIKCDWREIIFQMAKDYYKYGQTDDYAIKLHRNNYYLEYGIDLYNNGHTGYEQYYTDLEAFWRQLYCPLEFLESDDFIINSIDLDKNDYFTSGNFIGWNKSVINDPASLIFWFDFFDADGFGLNQYAVSAIGSRPVAESNDQINEVISTDTPDLIFISKEDYDLYAEAGRLPDPGAYSYLVYDDKDAYVSTESTFYSNYDFSGVSTKEINTSTTILKVYVDKDGKELHQFNGLYEGMIEESGTWYSAQEYIGTMLYNYAYAHETITITGVPIYHLEPNSIISAKDELHIVNGYYILNKIVLPLQAKGTMQLTAVRVPERIF